MKPTVLLVSNQYVPAAVEALKDNFDLHYLPSDIKRPIDALELPSGLADEVRGLATDATRGATSKFIERLPKLEIISLIGIGVDAVDRAAAAGRGIPVTNTPGLMANDVAALAIGLVLAASRRILSGDQFVRAGKWSSQTMPAGRRPAGKVLGILGLGRIGAATAGYAAGLGMRVLYTGPRQKPEAPYAHVPTLLELARRSDYLVVACTGGAETRNLVDAEVLRALGPEGTLVNIARGSVVDEPALVAALESGQLGFAAIDAFADEPRVPTAMVGMPNVILQPHHGYNTVEGRTDMAMMVVDNLTAHFSGRELLTPID